MDRVFLTYTHDALKIILNNLELYRAGSVESYRVIAVQLRLLLCDTTRIHGRVADVSLLGRILPELRLPAIRQAPTGLEVNPGEEPLPRLPWLQQTILRPDGQPASLRDIIRLVCDRDGGAHVDPRPGEPLALLAPTVVSLGELVLEVLNQTLN